MFRILNWKNIDEALPEYHRIRIRNGYDDEYCSDRNSVSEEYVHRNNSSEESTRTFSRISLGPKEHSVIDTPFFTEKATKTDSDDGTLKYDLLTNVCICMIDIVGFSSWCSNHLPNVIAKAMVDYNDWIGNFVEQYESVSKIELVGDSCMLLSGKATDQSETLTESYLTDSYLSMIRMAMDLLEDIESLRNIFKSSKIGIRIGIHVSDVIGIYLKNPYKYQMFGNDINVCSRLERSSIPNTIHISEKTLMCVQNACNTSCGLCSRSVKGGVVYQNYKGVGFKTSYQLFLKKNKICIVNMNALFSKHIMSLGPLECFRYQYNIEEAISDCCSYKYIGVVLNISQERDIWSDSKDLIKCLKSNEHFKQSVCLITTDAMLEATTLQFEYEFEDILSFQSPYFTAKLDEIFTRWAKIWSLKTQHGPLDLTIV